jgi:hypothetical protein
MKAANVDEVLVVFVNVYDFPHAFVKARLARAFCFSLTA